MIEDTLSEAGNDSEQSFYKDKEVVNLKKKLNKLKNNDKFRYFLKLNELDPVKILSMPNEESSPNLLLDITPRKESIDPVSDSLLEGIDLDLEDYVKFSYIICRLLECEEKHRLKTEEQYYQILEQQLSR